MKRIFALTLALAMMAAVLTGCKTKAQTTKKEEKSAASTSSSSTEFEAQTWKVSCSATKDSTWMKAARYFGELVSKETNGAVTLEYYPADELTDGNEADGVQELMEGTVDISLHSNLTYASFDPRFNVVSLPFLFDSTEDADAKLQNGTGGKELKKILDSSGLHCIGIGENGFRCPTNNKRPIATVADMKGLNMRVASSELMNRIYQMWGANTNYANWPEVFTALKTGKYDGQENSVSTANAASIQTVQKYVTKWTATYDCIFMCMNKDLYESLSSDLQKVVDDCGEKAMAYQRKLNRKQDEEVLAQWKSDGIVVTEPSKEAIKAFKKTASPCWEEFKEKLTPKLISAFSK